VFEWSKLGQGIAATLYIDARPIPGVLAVRQEPIIWAAEVTPTPTGSHMAFVNNYGPNLHPWQE
jgi:hypothetical protein